MKRTVYLLATLILMVCASWLYLESDPGDALPRNGEKAPGFIGSPAEPKPVQVTRAEQHPFLAATGRNSMHNDAGQTDTYTWAGPLGKEIEVLNRRFHRITGSCVAQSLDSKGRLLGTCVSPFGVTLVARDPDSLEILARQVITRWLPIGEKFSGGVYFHLDHEDRILLASNNLEVQRWELVDAGNELEWVLFESISIADTLNRARREQHHVIDVMPDWQGNYWFITRAGIVGMIGRDGSNGQAFALGIDRAEGIDNALAVGPEGVFLVSNHAMYRFNLDATGQIRQTWRSPYDRGSAPKPGTMGWGSGTTPSLILNDFVAVTDNADGQVNVMVYNQKDGSVACKQPIFPADKGTTENSLAVVGYSLIAENNLGYSGPKNVPKSEPGLARVDVNPDGSGCSLAWENLAVTSPSAVPKVSLANGLIYLYTRDEANPEDMHAWYFTGVDFHTGEIVFKALTGVGWQWNNHYGSISITPDGTAYVGHMGGVVKVRDAEQKSP